MQLNHARKKVFGDFREQDCAESSNGARMEDEREMIRQSELETAVGRASQRTSIGKVARNIALWPRQGNSIDPRVNVLQLLLGELGHA